MNILRRVLLIFLLFACPAFAQTLYYSTAAGNFSDGTKWNSGISPCGASGDNVFVSVQTTMTLDCDLGSATGINTLRVEKNGSLCSYDGVHAGVCGYTAVASRTITFNSTGTNAIGSGTNANPGSNATSMGLFMSYGTFNWVGSSTATLTIAPKNLSSTTPIWIAHFFSMYNGCTGITTTGCTGGAAQSTYGAVFTCQFCIGKYLGATSMASPYAGIEYDVRTADVTPSTSFDLENSELDYLNILTEAGTMTSGAFTIKNTWLNAPISQYPIKFTAATSTVGAILQGITETGATVTGGTTVYFIYLPGMLTYTDNVEISTNPSVQRGSLTTGGAMGTGGVGGPYTISRIFCANVEGTVPNTADCANFVTATADTGTAITNSVCWGAYQCFHVASKGVASSPTLVSNNWGAVYQEASAGQGVIESLGCSWDFTNNVLIVENDNNNIGALGYSGQSTCYSASVFHFDHNTVYAASASSYTPQGINLGDSSGSSTNIASPSWLRSNLIVGFYFGVINNPADSFSTTACGAMGVGVCYNDVYNYTASYGTPNHGTGTGWDNGTTYHPSAVYGDISVNPMFRDVTRRPTGYSTYCGGAGSLYDLGMQYAKRSQIGGYNTCYNVDKMLAWLQAGFQPQNSALATAGYGGTYIGAVPLAVRGIHYVSEGWR